MGCTYGLDAASSRLAPRAQFVLLTANPSLALAVPVILIHGVYDAGSCSSDCCTSRRDAPRVRRRSCPSSGSTASPARAAAAATAAPLAARSGPTMHDSVIHAACATREEVDVPVIRIRGVYDAGHRCFARELRPAAH